MLRQRINRGMCLIVLLILVCLGALGMGAYFMSEMSSFIGHQVKFLCMSGIFLGICYLIWKTHKADAEAGDETGGDA